MFKDIVKNSKASLEKNEKILIVNSYRVRIVAYLVFEICNRIGTISIEDQKVRNKVVLTHKDKKKISYEKKVSRYGKEY